MRIHFQLALLLAGTLSHGLPGRDGCPQLQASDFEKEVLFTTGGYHDYGNPNGIAPYINASGVTDLFAALYSGQILHYDGATQQVAIVMEMSQLGASIGNHEDGVNGIAVHPQFLQNGWVYIFYVAEAAKLNRVSRFKWNQAAGTLEKASEAVIIEFPVDVNTGSDPKYGHTGGGLYIDLNGKLWLGGGDNYKEGDQMSAERSSGCTSDLRGSIVRIQLLDGYSDGSRTPGIGTSYEIPSGNFSEFFSSVSPDYGNPAKVRPEIYAKGTRNAYTVSAHPTQPWVTWGDCGPDWGVEGLPWGEGETEEVNYTHQPQYSGFPYFTGKNLQLNNSGSKDPNSNIQPDPGRCSNGAILPRPAPSVDSYVWRKGIAPKNFTCATAAVLVTYWEGSEVNGGMPPQWHGSFLAGDWGEMWLKQGKYNETTGEFQSFDKGGAAFPGFTYGSLVGSTQGPDGMIYLTEHQPGGWWWGGSGSLVARIRYTGPPASAECIATIPDPTSPVEVFEKAKMAAAGGMLISKGRISIDVKGAFMLTLRSMDGGLVAEYQGRGSEIIPVEFKGRNMLIATLQTDQYITSKPVISLGN